MWTKDTTETSFIHVICWQHLGIDYVLFISTWEYNSHFLVYAWETRQLQKEINSHSLRASKENFELKCSATFFLNHMHGWGDGLFWVSNPSKGSIAPLTRHITTLPKSRKFRSSWNLHWFFQEEEEKEEEEQQQQGRTFYKGPVELLWMGPVEPFTKDPLVVVVLLGGGLS